MPHGPTVPCKGTELWVQEHGETAYTRVGNVLGVNLPNATVSDIPTTHLGTGQIKTSRPGRTDPGSVSFEIQYSPGLAIHDYLRSLTLDTPRVLNWRITVPTTPVRGEEFPGYVATHEPSAEASEDDADWTASISVRVSGAVTPYTAGS